MLAVAHVLGMMMAFFAVTFLMPLVSALVFQDGTFDDFAIAAGINVVAGLAIAAATRRYKRELKPRDGFLLVTLSWAPGRRLRSAIQRHASALLAVASRAGRR